MRSKNPAPGLFFTELVAGIMEAIDHGLDGLAAHAAAETHEEAGFVVSPTAFIRLGAGTLPSPG